jgi:hypothetical protein
MPRQALGYAFFHFISYAEAAFDDLDDVVLFFNRRKGQLKFRNLS